MALTKITSSVVAVNSLTAANIADNSIDATKIANNQILARHIANATALTLDGGVTIDNITIDGTEIDLSSGDLTLDVAGDIILDAGGGDWKFKDDGVDIGLIANSSSDLIIQSTVSDKDTIFRGVDGGSTIVALTLDMSAAGKATFNNAIVAQANSTIQRNDDTDYASTSEPAGILTLYNSNGSDGGGVNNYSSLEFNTGDGATSQGFINYVRTADNQGKFTFSQRTGSSSYAEAMTIDNSGRVMIGTTTEGRANEGADMFTIGDDGSNNSGMTMRSGTSGYGSIYFSDATSGTGEYAGYIQYAHNTNDMLIATDSNTRMMITSGGKILIGDTASHTDDLLQIETPASGGGHGIQIRRNDSNNDQGIGRIMFGNNTDTDLATIQATTDGSTDNARLGFFTQPNGGSSTERMRITSGGRIGQGTTSPGFNYDMIYSHATLGAMRLQNQGSFGTYNTLLQVDTFNSASANFQYLVCHSGNGSAINDIEFNLRGDANAYADGSWNGGGADYAEYFEWQDGNSSNEDRIGHSVSLVGNKIKIAESGETVIGVISGNPAVVGDTGWNKWHDKYQKDDYGRYLRNESGDKLVNTDYDDTKNYVTREARKEWDIVGLMGKLRIKKGQQTGTNWIKMRDISASVEEWLVR